MGRSRIKRDITEQKRAEQEIHRLNQELEERILTRTAQLEAATAKLQSDNDVINVIRQLQADYIDAELSGKAWDKSLVTMLKVTHCDFGFIVELSSILGSKPRLIPQAITSLVSDEAIQKMYAQFLSGELGFEHLEPLYGPVIANGKAFTISGPSGAVQHAAALLGIPQLIAFLGLPLYSNKELVGVLVLADGRSSLGDETMAHVEPLATACGSVLGARKLDRQRRQTEETLRRSNLDLEARSVQLKAANAELESFSYSVSHDLRSPLRAVDGFSRVLQEDYADKLDVEGQDLLQRMRAASQRMDRLIDGILDLSRMSRGELRRTTVDLSNLAERIARDLRSTNPRRQVEFAVAPGLVVNADPDLLRTAIENLLGNAWKFTRHHPQARIEIGTAQREGEQVYFVRDNGAGFDMSHASRMFGAFQRFHTQAEFEGTGIGLANVQRVIHRHGGRVWAEGEVEKGATFFFTLPAAPELIH